LAEPTDLRKTRLRLPLKWADINDREGRRVQEAAGVTRRKIHPCRHTSATYLLGEREPVYVVAERLGDSVTTILKSYAHAVASRQERAAETTGGLLGRG
jgi:integrase